MRKIGLNLNVGVCCSALVSSLVFGASLPSPLVAASFNNDRGVLLSYTQSEFDSKFEKVQAPTWEGFFIGGMLNAGQVTASADLVAGSERDYDKVSGGLGLYGGFNFGLGSSVFGIEGDLSTVLGDGYDDSASGITASKSSAGSARLKLGMPISDTVLGYGTIGLAFGAGELKDGSDTDDKRHFGWAGGIGADIALIDNLVARVEYRYTQLFDEDYSLSGRTISTGFSSHDLNLGLAYKF